MKTKKIAILVAVIICLGIVSSFSTISAEESPKLNEGEYVRTYWQMFQNHLWVDSTGLCVQGMHTFGTSTKTDLVVVGGAQSSGVSVQGYYPNMTNHIPVDYHNEAVSYEKVRDSVKFDNGGEMELIYARGYNDNTGRITCQDFKDPQWDGDNQLIPEWEVTITNGEPYALALGNFDTNAGDLEVAVVTMEGYLYVINNIQSGTAGPTLTEQFSDIPRSRSSTEFVGDKVKTPITAINDLDGDDATKSDIIVGHYQNVTAISTNTSNRIIWDVEVAYHVSDVVAVDDINSDGLQDVVAATRDGLYLLDGADGTELANTYEANSYTRDVEVYNSTAVISGNDDGDIFVWDINTASPTFDDLVLGANWGNDINDLLVVEDLDADGVNEIAIGADSVTGVVYGNNLTNIWTKGLVGNWNGGYIDAYDMELLEDLSGDGFKDFAVTGYSDHGAVFVYSTYGVVNFIPDLSGYGFSDTDCTEDNEHTFVFTATVTQKKGLTCTADISIDDEAWHSMTQGSGSWTGGMTFTYTHDGGFPSGDHTYKFRFIDTFPDEVITSNKTFQIGNCGGNGGLDIPGAGVWMLLASAGIGVIISLYLLRKRIKH